MQPKFAAGDRVRLRVATQSLPAGADVVVSEVRHVQGSRYSFDRYLVHRMSGDGCRVALVNQRDLDAYDPSNPDLFDAPSDVA